MKFLADGLLISIIWFLAIYMIKRSHIDKLLNLKISKEIILKILILSKAIVMVLIVVDLILVFDGDNSTVLQLKNIFRHPFISHLLIINEIILICHYAQKFSRYCVREVVELTEEEKRSISFANGIFAIGAYIILFFIRSFMWGNFTYLYSMNQYINLMYEVNIGLLLLGIPGIIILIAGARYNHFKRTVYYTLPFNLLLIFAYPIMIPSLVFIEFTEQFYFLLIYVFEKKEHDSIRDFLLLVSSSESNRTLARLNSYFLYGYFLTISILYTFQASPFIPSISLYNNSSYIFIFLCLVVVVFWLIEGLSRFVGKYGDLFRVFYIPFAIGLIVYPFYTTNSLLLENEKVHGFKSVFHIITNALGDNNYMFFVSLILLQGCAAYIMYLLTGTSHRKKSFYAILPLLILLQVLILAIVFPTIVILPPYLVKEKSNLFIAVLLVVGTVISVVIVNIIQRLFTYKKIKWQNKVPLFWKKKLNLYLIVTGLTLLLLMPIVVEMKTTVTNYNADLLWEEAIDIGSFYSIEDYSLDQDQQQLMILCNSEHYDSAQLINYDLVNKKQVYSINLMSQIESLERLEGDKLLLYLKDGLGFIVMNCVTGDIVYRYKPENPEALEYFFIESNERAILVTENTHQFVYDIVFGILDLDTISNNFYHIIAGDQLAIKKNDKIYLFDGEMFNYANKLKGVSTVDYVVYNEQYLTVINDNRVIHYKSDLLDIIEISEHSIGMEIEDYYPQQQKLSQQMIFNMIVGLKKFAYIIDPNELKYHSILLEQKIRGFGDQQSIYMADDLSKYLLYDQYQLTLFDHGEKISRVWFEEELFEYTPFILKDKVIYITKDGHIKAIKTE